MLENSKFIDGRSGSKELNENLKSYSELKPLLDDAEETVKKIKNQIKPFKEFILKAGQVGLNETTEYTFKITQKTPYETIIPLKEIKADYPEVYAILQEKGLLKMANTNPTLDSVTKR